MSVNRILAEIDAEIARLQQAKALLARDTGKKRASIKLPTASSEKPARKAKRRLSAEARARIAEAQRKRWAAQRAKAK